MRHGSLKSAVGDTFDSAGGVIQSDANPLIPHDLLIPPEEPPMPAIDRNQRLFPGAGWSPAHLETMLALRLNRANREWEVYWQGIEKEAACTGYFIDESF